ncbi:hypothetical protein [Kineosporia sp. R_H_3]|uniref:hypothetical protein n=1 Tax=Kineosporia sp. R_H_3 TaxID=1961848 RepID=UPI000B4B4A4B|nr:hypothetical protein [Kineosporia sp. R_H_3]
MTGPKTVDEVTASVSALVAEFLSHSHVHALATEAAAVRFAAQREADLVSEIARQLVVLVRQADDPAKYPTAAEERDALLARLKQSSGQMRRALAVPVADRTATAPLTKHNTQDCQWCSGYETAVHDSLYAAHDHAGGAA